MAFTIAALVFIFLVILIAGSWWVAEAGRNVKGRLRSARLAQLQAPADILRSVSEEDQGLLARTGLQGPLAALVTQAGIKQGPADFALVIVAVGLVAGALAWLRTGGIWWGILAALIAGSLPVFYLLWKRQRRMERFQSQFPDALDMISRAIRAGNALSGAINLVGDEMPDPMGQEFKQVSEEIRLGMDPGQALFRLEQRAPGEDIRFFCTAVRIQRAAGGNLAEILDRLAEVIRERFKILSYARVLSAQHRWSAICVGLSPVGMAVLFQIIRPGYFDPLIEDPIAPFLVGSGLVLEAIGFFMIWRIAQIKV